MSQTLSRGLEVLNALATGPKSIYDIAGQLDVHHSTALRLLHTLEATQFVRRQPDGRYRLGPRVAWLGQIMLEQVDLRIIARPFIEDLNATVGETVHLATVMDDQVIYVDKVESKHPVRMYSQIGKPAPLHCTGVAKAIAANSKELRAVLSALPQPYERYTAQTRVTFEELCADLDRYTEVGYILDDREHEDEIHCIAAAIYSSGGFATSAVSIAVPVHRCDRQRLLSFAPGLQKAARSISSQLGHLA